MLMCFILHMCAYSQAGVGTRAADADRDQRKQPTSVEGD